MTDKNSPADLVTETPHDGASPVEREDDSAVSASSGGGRGDMVAGERISVPQRSSANPKIGIAVGGLLGLAIVGGTIWWMLTPPTTPPAPKQPSAQVPSPTAGTPPAAPVTAPTKPPESRTADAPARDANADKPGPDTPAADPAATPVSPGPPLLPRTGPITDEAIEMVRRRAAAGELDAMEELARRYIEGVGVKVDTVEGARWLQRAAERGAPGAMFNVGVMYERGMMVDKDPAKALEWYGKASAAGVPMATHNMALMYREGDGIPADYNRAAELLLSAARHGMSASMYALGTMFEAGSHGQKRDPVQAIVWYAMALQFQRANPATQDSDLAKSADEKVTRMQRTLSEADLRRAQAIGEREYHLIVATLRSGSKKPPATAAATPPASEPAAPPAEAKPPQTASLPAAPVPATPPAPPSPTPAPAPEKPPAAATPPQAKAPASDKPAAAPKPVSAKERLTEIQKILFALHIYSGKIDGTMGPATRAAIKEFQRMAGLPDTGEPSAELVELLREQIPLTQTQ